MTQGPIRGDVDARIQVAKQVEGFEKGCGMARPRCARARRNPASHPTVPLAPAVGVSCETSRVSQESHGKTVGRRDGRMRQSPGLRGMDSCKSPRHGFEAKPSAKTEPSGRRHVQDVAGPEGSDLAGSAAPELPLCETGFTPSRPAIWRSARLSCANCLCGRFPWPGAWVWLAFRTRE